MSRRTGSGRAGETDEDDRDRRANDEQVLYLIDKDACFRFDEADMRDEVGLVPKRAYVLANGDASKAMSEWMANATHPSL